jgi:hypothetical protein
MSMVSRVCVREWWVFIHVNCGATKHRIGGRLQELAIVLYKVPARHAALKIYDVHI